MFNIKLDQEMKETISGLDKTTLIIDHYSVIDNNKR
jgi:hypothetical protein